MKTSCRVPSLILLVMFILSVGLSLAITTDYSSIFAGDLAVYFDGETIIYAEAQIIEPQDTNYFEEITSVNLHYSFDLGENWNQHQIPAPTDETWTHKPVLCDFDGSLVLAIGNARFLLSFSEDVLLAEELPDADFVLDTDLTPYPFMRDGEEHLFKVNQPYPDRLQYQFTKDGITDIRNPLYGYYYDTYKTMNNGLIEWGVGGEVNAPVCTRHDFYVRQFNNYQGVFNAPVICGGDLLTTFINLDPDDVFLGGAYDNIEFAGISGSNPVRETGFHINYNTPDRTIVFLDVQGAEITCLLGTLSLPRRVNADVYYPYPPHPDQAPLYTNVYTVRDTVWTPLDISSAQIKNLFVDGELWLKGDFSGHHILSASGDIKLIGDITLSNTVPGDDVNTNTEDSVHLIGERNVMIGYGYKHPITNERIHPFCCADSDPCYIYANIYALGKEQRTGLFTFEYQHPHPSVPAFYDFDYPSGQVTYHDNVDIHRYRYPPTATEPWPMSLDLPYYNPLWPEAQPYGERGKLLVKGNVFQNRYGYLHRSGNDSQYPSNNGVWDVENDMCGGPINTPPYNDFYPGTLATRPYPGAAGFGSGYKYEITPDLRFNEINTSIFSYVFDHGINLVNQEGIILPTINEKVVTTKATQKKIFAKSENRYAFAHNNSILYDDGTGNLQDLTQLNSWYMPGHINDRYKIVDMVFSPMNTLAILASYNNDRGLGLMLINLGDMSFQDIKSFNSGHEITSASLTKTIRNTLHLAYVSNNQLFVNMIWWGGVGSDPVYGWHCEPYGLVDNYVPDNCSISFNIMLEYSNGIFPIVLFENTSGLPYSGWGNVSFKNYYGYVSNEDELIPSVKDFALSCYPNPVRSLVQLKLDTPLPTEHHEVEIYNLRGQKVNIITDTGKKSNTGFEYDWNLKDVNDRKVSSGIYFIRIKVDGKTKISKKITVL